VIREFWVQVRKLRDSGYIFFFFGKGWCFSGQVVGLFVFSFSWKGRVYRLCYEDFLKLSI
jgi:hypothetical protein